MKKNKSQRLAAKAAATPSNETVNAVKAAVNVSSQEKAKPADESPEVKKVKSKKSIEPTSAPVASDKKKKEESLDDKNAAAIVEKTITEVKDLKYKYPETATTLERRKKFRAEVRRKMAAYEKEIGKLMTSKLKEDKVLLEAKAGEADAYAQTVYATAPTAPKKLKTT